MTPLTASHSTDVRGRIRDLRTNERGVSLVFVGMSFMAFMAVTTLAVDVGMAMVARNQAQNSADSGALAGAVALAFNDFNDHSSSSPATLSAKNVTKDNRVAGGQVSVAVTYPLSPSGASDRVQVVASRTAAAGNAVPTFIARIFGINTIDVVATAIAEASPSNAENCVLPFTIPDKWIERQTPPWDATDTFNAFPANPSLQPDVYHGPDQSNYTGYNADTDRGLQLTLKAGTGNNIAPSFYYGLALPGNSGAADYRWSISHCNTSVMHTFDLLTAEPGNMVGPTKQGVEDLIALDPNAYWDSVNKRVVSSMSPSPRIKAVPIFDPYYWNVGKQNGRTADLKASNFIGFFVEGMQGNDVIGRITPISGLLDPNAGPAPQGSFPKAIRLVQ